MLKVKFSGTFSLIFHFRVYHRFDDAKDAFKTGPEDLARETKESTKVDNGKMTHEYKSELKDQRGLGQKLEDAKDAFKGPAH